MMMIREVNHGNEDAFFDVRIAARQRTRVGHGLSPDFPFRGSPGNNGVPLQMFGPDLQTDSRQYGGIH
jgi:hypothetical protein